MYCAEISDYTTCVDNLYLEIQKLWWFPTFTKHSY